MMIKEFMRFAYGLFMGTSTPYLKSKNRYLFPTGLFSFDEKLHLLLGGSCVCAVLHGENEVLVINANQGPAVERLRDELVEPRGGAVKLRLVLSSVAAEFAAGVGRFTDAERVLVAASGAKTLRSQFRPIAERIEGIASERILEIGDERVHLIPIPAASTGSDLVIFLEKRALLFAGPLFYNHMQPVLRAGPGLKPCEWVRTLEELLARFQPRHVVPAEGDLGTEEDVREFIAYLKALSDPEVEFSYCRSNFDWPEIPGTTSLEENFDLVRGEKSHTTFG